MRAYCLENLADSTLIHALADLVTRDRDTTAALVAHIAEFDARRLYLPAGYPSTFAYCVGELRLSEDATYKRTQAARASRRFPVLFEALASGDLHLTAITLLAPHLTESNAPELIAAATRKTKPEIEQLLAARFPKSEPPTEIQALHTNRLHPSSQLAPEQVEASNSLPQHDLKFGPAPIHASSSIPEQAPIPCSPPTATTDPRAKTTPVSAERFALQLTMNRATHDKLRYVESLLSHCIRPGDLATVLDRALDALIERLEKRKFATTSRPRRPRQRPDGRPASPRVIPAAVKRAVWQRDGGRCTFVGVTGHRCDSRHRLEFDHVDPVARGGRATIGSIRLRCRAHNQFEAERILGTDYMANKRALARERAAASPSQLGRAQRTG